jgi:hypothetical protein
LVGFAAADWLSPQFTVNDLGFMRRANLFRSFGYLQLRDVHPNSVWQRAFVGTWVREIRNAASTLALEQDAGFETFAQLNSQWNFGASILVQTPYIDDRELGDGTPLERQGSWGTGAFFNSDSRKAVSYGGYADYARAAPRHERTYDFGAYVNVRPLAQLETTLELAFLRGDGTIRQIRTATPIPGACSSTCAEPAELDPASATQEPRLYLLAPQTSRSLSITGRGTYAFSPRLTLQLYAQLFGAGISYGSPLRAVAAPGKATVRGRAARRRRPPGGAQPEPHPALGMEARLDALPRLRPPELERLRPLAARARFRPGAVRVRLRRRGARRHVPGENGSLRGSLR